MAAVDCFSHSLLLRSTSPDLPPFNLKTPLLPRALCRVPLLSWLLTPFRLCSTVIYNLAEDLYAFVHDEIVPVALDLGEKFPLVSVYLKALERW